MTLKPDDRLLILGKTGKGKTVIETYVLDSFLAVQPPGWMQIVIDTQQDAKVNFPIKANGVVTGSPKELLAMMRRTDLPRVVYQPEGAHDTVDGLDEVFSWAFQRRACTVAVDELPHVVGATGQAGPGLKDVLQRGRARHVGFIALAQDPVYIPGYVKSQSSYIILLPTSKTYWDYYRKHLIPDGYGDIVNTFPTEHGFWLWDMADDDTAPSYVKALPIDPENPYRHPASCPCPYCRAA